MDAKEHLARMRKIENFKNIIHREFDLSGIYSPTDDSAGISIDHEFHCDLMRAINKYRFYAHEEFVQYAKNNKEEVEFLAEHNCDIIMDRLNLSLNQEVKKPKLVN